MKKIIPVAMRYDFDGYGYKYIDSGSGSDWQTREQGEFLYTKPFFSQKPVAMMYKDDKFVQFTETCGSAVMNHPDWTPLYEHPELFDARSYLIGRYDRLRELTNEEIESEWFNIFNPEPGIGKNITNGVYDFARAILKKASEK